MSNAGKHEREKSADGGLRAPATEGKAIRVVFDLNDREQAEKLEGYRSAFGDGYAETEPLVDGKVVLMIFPGGAKQVRR